MTSCERGSVGTCSEACGRLTVVESVVGGGLGGVHQQREVLTFELDAL